MPLHDDPDFQNFSGDTSRICLQCGYRWPIDDLNVARITENPGCPECGFATADILTECKAPNWDEDELLISARVEIEIFASTVEGFKTGWLKDRVDELLKVLIAADLDTCSRLSAAPASEYMGMPGFPPGAPGAASGANRERIAPAKPPDCFISGNRRNTKTDSNQFSKL